MGVKITTSNETPCCPHCKREVPEILAAYHGSVTIHTVYFCPHDDCRSIVGVGRS